MGRRANEKEEVVSHMMVMMASVEIMIDSKKSMDRDGFGKH